MPKTPDEWEPDPKFDLEPARRPYPDSMPDLLTKYHTPVRDVHVTALHAVDRAAHEDAVLVDGGDYTRLPQLKRAILESVCLRQELTGAVVTPSKASERYLDMQGPEGATA